MRVLVVHNRYSSAVPSGENAVVDHEVRWLREASVDVDLFEARNDDVMDAGPVARVSAGVSALWNRRAAQQLRERIERFRPDVVHVHNVFPLLSASVLSAALSAAPVVWTVHNYRIACVAGTFSLDGRPCHECASTHRLAGVRHACYASSRTASAAVTIASSSYARLARRGVFAAPVSAHVGRWLVEQGFAPDRVHVKHNGVDDPGSAGRVPPSASTQFLFLGRLAPEKGIRELLTAWGHLPGDQWSLVIAGGGELESEVAAAAAADPRIVPVGAVPPGRVLELMRGARAVVLPSQWEEPFPRSAVEAVAVGRPVVTSGLGGLAEAVDAASGWVTGPTVEGLGAGLAAAAASDGPALDTMGTLARRRFETSFTPAVTTRALQAIYDRAIASFRQR